MAIDQINPNDHQGLIHFVLNSNKWIISKTGFSEEDVIQECNIGLLKAIENYNPELGSFSTYAIQWIKQALYRAYYNKGSLIRKPLDVHRQYKEYTNFKNTFAMQNNREPTEKEISLLQGIPVSKQTELIQSFTDVISLDTPISESEDEDIQLIDSIPDETDSYSKVLHKLDILSLREDFEKYMNEILTEQEQELIKLRFNWSDTGELTYSDIGELKGLSPDRVRKLIESAITKLRRVYGRTLYKNYPDLIQYQITNTYDLKNVRNLVRNVATYSLNRYSNIIIRGRQYKCIGSNNFYVIYTDGETTQYIDLRRIEEIVKTGDNTYTIELQKAA